MVNTKLSGKRLGRSAIIRLLISLETFYSDMKKEDKERIKAQNNKIYSKIRQAELNLQMMNSQPAGNGENRR